MPAKIKHDILKAGLPRPFSANDEYKDYFEVHGAYVGIFQRLNRQGRSVVRPRVGWIITKTLITNYYRTRFLTRLKKIETDNRENQINIFFPCTGESIRGSGLYSEPILDSIDKDQSLRWRYRGKRKVEQEQQS